MIRGLALEYNSDETRISVAHDGMYIGQLICVSHADETASDRVYEQDADLNACLIRHSLWRRRLRMNLADWKSLLADHRLSA